MKFFTHTWANKILNALARAETFTPPLDGLFLVLFTTCPDQTGAGAVEATGYTRPSMPFETAVASLSQGSATIQIAGVPVQDIAGIGYASAASGTDWVWVNTASPLSVTGDGNILLEPADYSLALVPAA